MFDGILRFARYAFPPNVRGLCGPDSSGLLSEAIDTGIADPELVEVARGFSGAWPYLELIAGSVAEGQALASTTVDGYWLADPSARLVPVSELGDSLRDRFAGRRGWSGLSDSIPAGGWPVHAYHVFLVYPWIGLIRSGSVDPGLTVVDRCRIRWGTVLEVFDDTALVASDRLAWDGQRLVAGDPHIEKVSLYGERGGIVPGALVSLHWDWICEPITERNRRHLETAQRHHLALANHLQTIKSLF